MTGKADAQRSLTFSRLAMEVTNASKDSNGDMTNQRLLAAMAAAKKGVWIPHTQLNQHGRR